MHVTDMILFGGNVITMAAPNRRAQAVAVDGCRIEAIGDTDAVQGLAKANTRLIDLAGKTLLPGLIDSHVHLFLTGLGLASVALQDATSVADVCDAIGERARCTPRGRWVYGMGCLPWALREARYPTLSELDEAAPDNPVYISAVTFHSGATNTRGLGEIDLSLELPGLEKDASGRPTGAFVSDDAHFAAAGAAFGALSRDEITEMYRAAAHFAASRGVTTLHCLEGQFMKGDEDVLALLRLGAGLPVHTVVYYQTMDVPRVVELGLPRIGGCLTIDGSGFDHTALMYEPYTDRPSTRGDLYIPEARVREFVSQAHAAGLQVAMHAIGDHAVDILVRAYAEALEDAPQEDRRHRAEHFYVPSEWAIAKAAELGLALPMQPAFAWLWDREADSECARLWGRRRADRAEPYVRLCERGMMVAGGSDSPVTEIDPLLGIHAAANHPHVARRVSVEEALRMFTVNGAWAAFQEEEKGTVEVGKLADLTVIDGDPFAEPGRIKDFSVEMTIKAGEVVYERPGLPERLGPDDG
jgi:predicted amidohydrolase YtcJ